MVETIGRGNNGNCRSGPVKTGCNQGRRIAWRNAGPRARKISFAISQTAGVTPQAVDRIGQSFVAQLDNKPERAFATLPEDRIAAILTAAYDDLRD